MKRENLDKMYNKIYEIVSEINKKYKLDEDSLEILKAQGFIPFVQDLKKKVNEEGFTQPDGVIGKTGKE